MNTTLPLKRYVKLFQPTNSLTLCKMGVLVNYIFSSVIPTIVHYESLHNSLHSRNVAQFFPECIQCTFIMTLIKKKHFKTNPYSSSWNYRTCKIVLFKCRERLSMSWLQNANMQILPSIDQTDQWCLVKCTHQKFKKYAFYQIH